MSYPGAKVWHSSTAAPNAAFRVRSKAGSSQWPDETQMSKELPDVSVFRSKRELHLNSGSFEEEAWQSLPSLGVYPKDTTEHTPLMKGYLCQGL